MPRVTWEQAKAALIKANKQGADCLRITNRFAINDFAAATLLIAAGLVSPGKVVQVDDHTRWLRYDITEAGKRYRHGGNIVFQPPPPTNVLTFNGPLTVDEVDRIRKAWRRNGYAGAQGYRE